MGDEAFLARSAKYHYHLLRWNVMLVYRERCQIALIHISTASGPWISYGGVLGKLEGRFPQHVSQLFLAGVHGMLALG